jgi:hypothetical protein
MKNNRLDKITIIYICLETIDAIAFQPTTMTTSLATNLFLLAFALILLPSSARAFGAGDIPDFSYLERLY